MHLNIVNLKLNFSVSNFSMFTEYSLLFWFVNSTQCK